MRKLRIKERNVRKRTRMLKYKCVRTSVCLFFSLSVIGVCNAFILVLESFNDVSREFEVSRVF